MNPACKSLSASTLAAILFSSPNFLFFCATGRASLNVDSLCVIMAGSTPGMSAAVHAKTSAFPCKVLLS